MSVECRGGEGRWRIGCGVVAERRIGEEDKMRCCGGVLGSWNFAVCAIRAEADVILFVVHC